MELQQTSQEIYEKKYQLKDKDGNPVDKDINDTFKRVATGLAELEPFKTEDQYNSRDYWYNEFLWALQNGAIPAGRILANAGAEEHKSNVSTINCIVSEHIKDSIDGIGQGVCEAMVSLSKGSGVGFCFSLLRPKGAHVAGIGASTSGPLSFAEIYDAACSTISSAGGRRGAMMMTFHVHHPDVVDVIKAKREPGRLTQFNISLLITDKFMEAVKQDYDWKLYFPMSKHEYELLCMESNGEKEYTGLPKSLVWKKWPIIEDNYVEREGLIACKVYNTIKARDLWNLIMQSSYDYGEPGFLLIDKINRENNLYFEENITATNPSMPKGTLVHTDSGIFPIDKLENKEFKVRTNDGSWNSAKCFLSSNNAELIKLEFNQYINIRSTPEHKWPVYDKLTGQINRTKTSDLKIGDKIIKNSVMNLDFNTDCKFTEDDGFFIGLFLADGHISKRKDYDGYSVGITFNPLEKELADRILNIINSKKEIPSNIKQQKNGTLAIQFGDKSLVNWMVSNFGIVPGEKKFPDIVWKSNNEFIRGFIDGLISGDGSINDGLKQQRLNYTSCYKDLLFNFSKLLSFMGITGTINFYENVIGKFPNKKTYNKKYSCWRLNIGKLGVQKFGRLFSLTCKRKNEKLKNICSVDAFKNHQSDLFNTVKKINKVSGNHKVWDISVYGHHHVFPTEWGYTGNCGEQP